MKNILEWVKDILIAVVIAGVILLFFKPIIIQQHSMEPNFQPGDYVITSRQAYTLFGEPERGDIIVFKSQLLDEEGNEKSDYSSDYITDDFEDSFDDSTGSDADIEQYREHKSYDDEDEDL